MSPNEFIILGFTLEFNPCISLFISFASIELYQGETRVEFEGSTTTTGTYYTPFRYFYRNFLYITPIKLTLILLERGFNFL